MASLQQQYNLIKEGKSTAKDVFLKHAKALFPNLIPTHFGFDVTTQILKQKSIITENYIDIKPSEGNEVRPKEIYETKFEQFLLEEKKKKEATESKIKADLKKTDKSVEDIQDNDYDQKDTKSVDNVIYDQLQRGIYFEMSQNPDQDLKKIKDKVLKNLTKDPIYYTKNTAFGIEMKGYTDEATALKLSKTDKMVPVTKEKVKSNVKDGLTKTESAKKGSKPKEVKTELTQTPKSSKGVKKMDLPGKEKIIKLKEGMSLTDLLSEDNIEEGPLEDTDAKLAKDAAAKESELANLEKQKADNKLKMANAKKNV